MNSQWDVYVVIAALGCWFLFPLGFFVAVGQLDKNSDQLLRLHRVPRRLVMRAQPSQEVEEWLTKSHFGFHFKRVMKH